jgi:cyclase
VLSIPLTVGGGVRTAADVDRLLRAGADRVAVNSAAVAKPEILSEMAERFGRQCTVISIDAGRREAESRSAAPQASPWEVVVASGKIRTSRDAVAWAREAVALGAGEVLLTSLDRDGTRDGYDLELLSAVSAAVKVPVIASGGADRWEHLLEALQAGAHAVLAASIFHSGETTVREIKQRLASAGVVVRP